MELETADIVATKPKTFWEKVANRLQNWMINPPTDDYHFFLIVKKIDEPDNNDYLILESIPRGGIFGGGGLSTGTLALYEGYDLTFYRVDCPLDLREQVPVALIKNWARGDYDRWLPIKLFGGAIRVELRILWHEHRFRKLRVEELPRDENKDLICTEAVAVGYDAVGVNIIPSGTIAIPSAFRQAEIEGRIYRIDK